MAYPHHASLTASTALLALFTLATAAPVAAQSNPAADRNAYDQVMLCTVASITASELRKDRGDAATAAIHNANAARAYRFAVTFGERLGFSRERIERDFDAVSAREGPRLAGDVSYAGQTVERCRALGLM